MQLRVLAMCKPYPSPFKITIPCILGVAFVIQAISMSVILGFSYAHLLCTYLNDTVLSVESTLILIIQPSQLFSKLQT